MLLVYYLVPAKFKNAVLFLSSVVFYAVGEPIFVLLLLGLTFLNHIIGSVVFWDRASLQWSASRRKMDKMRSKPLFVFAVLMNAGVLVLCKVLALTDSPSFLPIGLSFYIFKMISYQADLYMGRISERPSFIKTAAYFTMFPQITQGPIMRYGDGFLTESTCSFEQFEDGLVYITMGLGMKILLADRLAILWNEIIKIGYESISTPLAWLGAYGYSFQLYFDFWGYSLIAGGVGVMLGFPFIEIFIHPYAADSIGDFYRRWHATLGSWFRDYIYIPLGGSRVSAMRNVFNLMIVWVATGLWHGGTLNFVIWGVILGIIIILEKFPLHGVMKRTQILGRFNVLVLIPLTWVVFAISNLQDLGTYFGRLFPFFGIGETVNPEDFTREFKMFGPLMAAAAVLCVPAVYEFIVRHRKNPIVLVGLTVVFWASVYYMVNSSGNTFMYFSF